MVTIPESSSGVLTSGNVIFAGRHFFTRQFFTLGNFLWFLRLEELQRWTDRSPRTIRRDIQCGERLVGILCRHEQARIERAAQERRRALERRALQAYRDHAESRHLCRVYSDRPSVFATPGFCSRAHCSLFSRTEFSSNLKEPCHDTTPDAPPPAAA